MKKRFLKIGLIVLGIVVFLIFAIYLPNLDAAFWEKQQVGQYMLVKQDKQEESIHYNLPLADKLSILSSQEGDFFCTEILIIHSIANLELEASGILEGMQESLSQLENEKMIPKLKSEEDLRKSFDSAVYYNVSSTENTSVVVPVWKLTFYEEEEFYYQFLVDADTYQIYSVNVYGFGVYDFLLENGIFTEVGKACKIEDAGYQMGNQWKEYFKADDFQIVYLEEDFHVEGMLSYWTSESEEADTVYSSGKDFDGHVWLNTIKSNNDYPHAEWWSYNASQEISYNPTACLLGFILKYDSADSELYALACSLTKEAYEYFKKEFPMESMHTVSCFVELYEYMKECFISTLVDMNEFKELLQKQIHHVLTYDKSIWTGGF